jgi:hypothetical protein
MRFLILLAATLALTFTLACGDDDDDDSDDSSAEEDPTAPVADDEYETDLFDVDSVEVLTLESFPVQITVAAHGTLPGSSCTEIHNVDVEQEGSAFLVTIETRRLKDAVCTADIAEHTENVNLGSPEPGDYTVTVNDVSAEFSVPGDQSDATDGSSDGDGQAGAGEPPATGDCVDYSGAPPDQAVSSDDPPPCPTEPIDESEYIFGEFQVESVDVSIAESFPVQVFVAANGYLGDGCTEIHEVDVQQNGNEFEVTITTRRPAEAICTQQLVGHTENVGLGSPPPGDYTVTVNGVSQSFTVPG